MGGYWGRPIKDAGDSPHDFWQAQSNVVRAGSDLLTGDLDGDRPLRLMGSMRTRQHMITTIAVAATLAASGCGSTVEHGDVSPASVEQKARALTRQTLDAIHPVIGSAATSVGRSTWQKCPTETPGQHRFLYTYRLNLDISATRSAAVMKAAKDHFTKAGYVLDPPDDTGRRAGATLPRSTWTVRLGVKDGTTTVIAAGSDCVFTTHDPPATGTSS
ncbi:hypothetical protein [Actinacidiphila acidipaludis]|uniref:Lipoprotein n=1 Tax=Actinacidiphila acidipaludis TaxID=2873382 RepID=A0ABS7QCB5_9ACTN|nr:hypothetical protein [Streptomyces acidipaludis]MBY8880791.1 hypothetical protein [Streptomyces acidipaludis]